MADRIDPLAPWFSMESLDSGEAMKDSRVTHSPASESSQMQPRVKQTITLHAAASILQPRLVTVTFLKDFDGILYNTGGTGVAGRADFIFPLDQIPPGSKIYEVSIRHWIQTPNHADRWIQVDLVETLDDSTWQYVLNSTQQGSAAWSTSTYSNVNDLPYIALDGATYFLQVSLQKAAGDANTDVRLMWIKVKYQLPG